ncbi:MAG: succinate-semialdehyde dehydrogenase/glutarate-semialdehyde dehydrogenase, partial [Myxococcota bacterium]
MNLEQRLRDPSLVRRRGFIGGVFVEAASGASYSLRDPADDTPLGVVADMGAADTERAIDAAASALPAWRDLTAKQRGAFLERWHDLQLEHVDDLAAIMTAEMGKPLAEARGEVRYGASFVKWFAEEGKRAYGDIVPTFRAGARVLVLKQPIGVVGAITPWNFPSAMITRKCAPALAAGCTVVVKPAEATPLSALALAVLADRAGIPAGVFNVIPCDRPNAPTVGSTLTASPKVAKIGFTGSTAVGKQLMRQAADTVKRVSLELGGNAPLIIFEDADLEAAVEGTLISKFRNTGQTCICANRIFVQSRIYDRYAALLNQAVSGLRQGSGFEAGVALGPLVDDRAVAKVQDLVDDALASGAIAVCGGRISPL